MQAFTDQTGHTIFLPKVPERIISLVPSQTELLFDLGLHDEVVGITRFCVHPAEWTFSKTRIGGTKKLHMQVIDQLDPDLIIANKEENEKNQVEELAGRYPTWTSDVQGLDSAYEMIGQVGAMTGRSELANNLINEITVQFRTLRPPPTRPRVAYLIWQDPYMTVGSDSFIHSTMEAAGWDNAFSYGTRYPVITTQQLLHAGCQVILLSSEPFPFKQKHADKLRDAFADAGLRPPKIMLADGEMFSWYGSHLRYSPGYFNEINATLGDLL